MNGERLGTISLRLDAVYCLILGAIVAASSTVIATVVDLPALVILLAGLAVMGWAGLVEWMRSRLDLRVALRWVLIANVVATLAVALVSMTAATVLAVLAILAISVDIALFAGSQALALGRLRTTTR